MNAERKKALIPILKGSGQTLEVYSFEQALSDMHIYYQAGTFLGALQAVQKDSGVKEGQADEETDISQIAFKSMTIILKLRRRCNGFPSAAVR